MSEKTLGADAAAVDTARSASDSNQRPHAAPTKGPWTVKWYYSDFGNYAIEGELNVARTFSIGDEAEELANAHLIAAAPELLEALKRAREALKANEEISGTWELYQSSPEMKAINAAIAKAEGRR